MRILMKTTSAGPEGTKLAGREYDVSKEEADALIAGNYAEPAKTKPVERATKKPGGENADAGPDAGQDDEKADDAEKKQHVRKVDDIEKPRGNRK